MSTDGWESIGSADAVSLAETLAAKHLGKHSDGGVAADPSIACELPMGQWTNAHQALANSRIEEGCSAL